MTPRARPALVLVADDDRDTRELYRAFFDISGYRTAEAGTGSDAIASAVEFGPDVLLTDYVMPDVDGLTISRRLKSDSRTASIRIVMVTGYATPDLDRRALAAGIDRVLSKPALPQLVMREIARVLARPALAKPQRAPVLPLGQWTPATEAAPAYDAVARIRTEFSALPGLALTAEQARLVFDLAADAVEQVLHSLVSEGFLRRTVQGSYRRNW